MDVKGKVVFITGAAQGLGKAYTEALLERGAKVFFGDVNASAGAVTLEEMTKRFGPQNVRFTAFDVTDHQQFKEAFQSAVSTFGHVDVLVNNAGIMDESRWQLQIAINYTALIFGTNLAVEHMRKDRGGLGGRIINISSVAGLADYYFIPTYCGTKHAVRSYTASLAQQPNVEQLGVEFGILCPEATATDLILKLDQQKVPHLSEIQEKLDKSTLQISAVVDAFLELLQLEKMNGATLLVQLAGTSYRKVEHRAV